MFFYLFINKLIHQIFTKIRFDLFQLENTGNDGCLFLSALGPLFLKNILKSFWPMMALWCYDDVMMTSSTAFLMLLSHALNWHNPIWPEGWQKCLF